MKSFSLVLLFLLMSLSALASSPFIDGPSPRVFPSSGFFGAYDDRGLYPPVVGTTETTDIDPAAKCYKEVKVWQAGPDGLPVQVWELEEIPCPQQPTPPSTGTNPDYKCNLK